MLRHTINGLRQALFVGPVLMFGLLVAAPAKAQDGRPDKNTIVEPVGRPQFYTMTSTDTPPGKTANSAAGRAGVRQSRQEIARDTGIQPLHRISSRIQNRVDSRIRNRIDRDYDPQANAAAPFVRAGEQLRTARPRR